MKIIIRCLWLFIFIQPLIAHAELVVSHRSPYAPGDTHHVYSTALLQLALEKTRPEFGDYRLNPIPPRNYARALKALVDNDYPNLVIETSYEQALTRNSNLAFINFPVDLGVLGYRVCFMNPKLKTAGVKLDSLKELSRYSFVHGVGWADTLIFRHNGLKVREIDNYDSIFLMVIGGRVDFFCRGVNEILGEIEQFSQLNNLVIDDHFMLVYPLPRFFYFNTASTLARERIEAGLKKAYADGSLQTLWKTHYHTSLDYVRIKGRKIIAMENPLLEDFQVSFTPDFIQLLDDQSLQKDIKPQTRRQ